MSRPVGVAGPDMFASMPQVSPAMLNYGVETTSNILKTQRDLYMPGVSSFWHSLKIYFMVSNNYVGKKITLVLFPFTNKNWDRTLSDDYAVSVRQTPFSM
jgi:hypothetical protein